jgi:hypothetical protein
MLMFDPDSTARSLTESLDFLEKNADIPMNFCRTEIYVGTPLHKRLSREGRLIGDVFGWDYEIGDPAAERAFRIFAQAFLDRNFRCDGLMNSTLGLGYHLHLLRQFYPGVLTPELRAQTEATVRAVNLDCVAHMRSIVDFADAGSLSDAAAVVDDFAGMMTERVNRAGRLLEERVQANNRAIFDALHGRPAKASRARTWAGSLAAAAIALSACDKGIMPPPPDPLPMPQTGAPPDSMGRDAGAEPDASEAKDAGVEDASAEDGKDAGAEPSASASVEIPPPPDPLPPPTTTKKKDFPPPPDPLPPPNLR